MSDRSPVTVVARWLVKPGAVDAVLPLVESLRVQTLAEAGCLGYDVFRSVSVSRQLLLIERYTDGTAIDTHRACPHYQDLVVGRIVPMLEERHIEFLVVRDPS